MKANVIQTNLVLVSGVNVSTLLKLFKQKKLMNIIFGKVEFNPDYCQIFKKIYGMPFLNLKSPK